jgi:hypothetical protein
VALVAESLPRKCRALRSNSNIIKDKKKKMKCIKTLKESIKEQISKFTLYV